MREPSSMTTAHPRLELNAAEYMRNERLVAYEVGNALLMLNLELQKAFGLRAEEYQVHLLIVLSTVQRYVRSVVADDPYRSDAPLPADRASSISRRRISEVLGIPLETVRRIVSKLLDMGLIVERRRGALSTPGGTLRQLENDASPDQLTRRLIGTINTLMRTGAVQVVARDHASSSASQ